MNESITRKMSFAFDLSWFDHRLHAIMVLHARYGRCPGGVLNQKSDGGVRTGNLKTHPPTHIFSGIYQYLQIFDKYLLTFQVFRKFLYDIKKNRFKSRDSR